MSKEKGYKRGIEYKSLSERKREGYYKVSLKLLIWETSNRRNFSFVFVVRLFYS